MTMLVFYLVLPFVMGVFLLFSIIPAILRPFDPKAKVYHFVLKAWSRLALAMFRIKVTVHGRQRDQSEENCIYIVNHSSYIDIPVLGATLRDNIVFVYKEELDRTPIWGMFIRLSPHIGISRTEGREAFDTIAEAGRSIREGNASVVIFPEGTRTTDGSLGEFKRGGFLLATRSGVPIVPVAIRGTHTILPRDDWRVRPGHVDVMIGEPINVPLGVSRPQEKAILAQMREQLERMLQHPPSKVNG
ncbi:MAG: 1-acyl-sn-glycerol-3-phosphate acyltransferase [bacterium]|nr:1-acyl-sn-glycerol-3-phosphate acyltransferase [Candidatus Kapabacteria bacterium]